MSQTRKGPDRRKMADAVRDFLRAANVDLTSAELDKTPERVAEAWDLHFLDGYRSTPAQALGERSRAPKNAGLVVVTQLAFHSMCPHHLLPVSGVAHLAYLPGRWIVGLGRLSSLLNCLAHRLVIQEQLARDVATALATQLESPAAACVLEARHDCVRVRGERQRDARVYTAAYEGMLAEEGPLRRELLSHLELGR